MCSPMASSTTVRANCIKSRFGADFFAMNIVSDIWVTVRND
jgi:hypothetical protein